MEQSLSYIDQLVAHGLLMETGVDGVYARSAVFEDVIARFDALITAYGSDGGAEVVRFPPQMSREEFERSGYMKGFPQLAGTVHCFMGDEHDHHDMLDLIESKGDWAKHQKQTEIVLTPAACYPIYPIAAKRGAVPPEGLLFDVMSYCFRHEPSRDPTRMQSFRMREYVRIGTPEQVLEFRASWLEKGQNLMRKLGVPMKLDIANDPFFGRTGKMLANNQREQELKFELLIPVVREDRPTACLSFNYHQDHLGGLWKLKQEDGETAHTACVAFGMERVALSLFRHHGFNVQAWPKSVREILWS
ncbi:amino acid--[acyl-carrier-protein] ligase [Dongia soli]|uniref:Amino acid--[acyl-carrier-protein] ligase n=1 Tax=Dongia soli TaxID=600628 RepID=A0ABU5ED28_9PROT|nr:amino acid--[acyl-carrier-protein] ligase [Dongia soli]MDY0884249.1 amino acid--[acyl-carrier-protein] ligase [Dongia soli]